jgi:hypothetical protein
VIEGLTHIVRGRTIDLDRGVAPARAMELMDAGGPLASDTDAPGDSDAAVDDEQLAVVAGHEPEPGAKSRGVEHGDGDTGPPQLLEKLARRPAGADPVEQQSNVDAPLDRGDKPIGESLADVVRPEDVTLE